VCRTLRSYRKRLAAQQSAVPLPPAALRELEKELRLTVLALGARAEGCAVDEAELGRLLKRDEGVGGEKKRTKSTDAGNGEGSVNDVGCQQSAGLDVDAVVGALEVVELRDEE
jgi:hypothetical protein